MKTPGPPRSSKGRDKAEESAPKGKTPMARFRAVAASVVRVPRDDVLAAEEKQKRKKRKD